MPAGFCLELIQKEQTIKVSTQNDALYARKIVLSPEASTEKLKT